MELRIFTEPQQGASYADILAVAQKAEELGFGAFFRSDHYLKMGSVDGLPGPSDAWTTLAGLARDTSSIRLGTLVTSATFRLPGVLAIQAANVDDMSDGRVELGLGAGWFEEEHEAYGIPFPALGERFDRLEEQLEIITGLWATEPGATFDFEGKHYTIKNSPGLPKPVQTRGHAGSIPVIVGGGGKKRTPTLAAAFADEFNAAFVSVEDSQALFENVGRFVEAAGRDDSIIYSAAQVLCVGRDEDEIARRAQAIGREPAELRENGLAGTPDEVVAKIKRFEDAGASRIYLQVLDLSDLDHLGLVADEVMQRV
ncbi:LLM class F420-dependent oxidoreductase [Nocardioides albus]|uniref:F420-dependent oxidoreductase-like protein n=1 Tax=Nocardioides albus TaxID=1841 RepID=A0A7W5A4S2_9ACTN|nr:LLM class F420-dependent oxidoreductase [Nocardioides albus]MBB3089683.1 F420-dependent oxidoreductase-like protein [Nocardioides albus]GGU30103.1 LLM class F420-dependent oxidoreductase [Nocardioides albus]